MHTNDDDGGKMKKFIVSGFILAVLFGVTTTASATVSDGEIVTSKLYVDGELAGKQPIINRPADNGKVALYTNSAGTLGARAIYSESAAYSGQQAALIEAQSVNGAIQQGLDSHVTCHTYSNLPGQSSDCWLWQINSSNNNVYIPQPAQQSGD